MIRREASSMRRALLACVACVAALPWRAGAQEEPLFDQMRSAFQRDYLAIGVVVQTVGDFRFDPDERDGTNGFSISTARLRVRGALDGGLSYDLQTDFTRIPALLDARVSYAFSPRLSVDAGLFKAPFSAELLIPAPSIDFVNRAQVVSALAANRQVGVALRGANTSGSVSWSAGAFNGNARAGIFGNDNDALLYVGRLVVRPALASGSLEIAGNVGYSRDEVAAGERERLIGGGDLRLTVGRWLLSGEGIVADLEPEVGPGRRPSGFHATAGYMLVPGRHQLLARFDIYSDDEPGGDSDQLVIGYNFWPTSAFEFQANYLVPLADGAGLGEHGLLLNFQVAF